MTPQAVWSMALADFEVLVNTMTAKAVAAQRERAHARAEGMGRRR